MRTVGDAGNTNWTDGQSIERVVRDLPVVVPVLGHKLLPRSKLNALVKVKLPLAMCHNTRHLFQFSQSVEIFHDTLNTEGTSIANTTGRVRFSVGLHATRATLDQEVNI
jgi:hypothetical protein